MSKKEPKVPALSDLKVETNFLHKFLRYSEHLEAKGQKCQGLKAKVKEKRGRKPENIKRKKYKVKSKGFILCPITYKLEIA